MSRAGVVALLVAVGVLAGGALWWLDRDRDAERRAHDARVRAAEEATSALDQQWRATERLLRQQQRERRADSVRWARERARIERRRQPVEVLVPVDLPDTCRPVVASLVEQLAVRDSIITTDSIYYEGQIADWRRVAETLYGLALQSRNAASTWESVAKRAPIQRPARVSLQAHALGGIAGVPNELAAGAAVRVLPGMEAIGERVWSETGGWRIGVRARVRLF